MIQQVTASQGSGSLRKKVSSAQAIGAPVNTGGFQQDLFGIVPLILEDETGALQGNEDASGIGNPQRVRPFTFPDFDQNLATAFVVRIDDRNTLVITAAGYTAFGPETSLIVTGDGRAFGPNTLLPRATSPTAAGTLLDEIYELCAAQLRDKAVRRVMSEINIMLRDGRFDECETLLESAETNVDRLNPETMLALLSITYAARARLGTSRTRFLATVRNALLQRFSTERVASILRGLA